MAAGLPSKISPNDVSSQLSNRLGLFTSVTVFLISTLTALVMSRYPLTRASLTEIRHEAGNTIAPTAIKPGA